MNARKWLWPAVLAATLVRCVLAAASSLSPQESYYFVCAQHAAPAYFDGPAGTALFVSLFQFPGGMEIWRLLFPLWGLAATMAVFALARNLAGADRAAWCALALNALPIFNLAGVRAGPLLPALSFVALGMLCVWHVLQSQRTAFAWWAGAGLSFAGGAFFHYAAAVFGVFAAAPVLLSPKHRRPGDFFGAGILLLILFASLWPALAWNARWNWIPLAGNTMQTWWEFHLAGFFAELGRFLFLLSPLIGPVLLIAWAGLARASLLHLRARFVFVLGLPAVVLWFYASLRAEEGLAWIALGLPVLLVPLTAVESRWPRWLGPGVGLAAALSVWALIGNHREGSGWKETAEAAADWIDETSRAHPEGIFVVADDAPKAAILGYYLRKHLVPAEGRPLVYVRESQDIANQFALWPSYDDFIETTVVKDEYFTEQKGENPFVGHTAIYVGEEPPDALPQSITAAFESVTLLEKREAAAGHPALHIYRCDNYQTMPL